MQYVIEFYCLKVKMSNKKTLLLIGAGPTSSLISYAISTNVVLKNSVDIHVWEKSRGIGGRFATSRSTKNPDCYVDLGAQYLTQSLDNPTSKVYFDNLKKYDLLRPLDISGVPGFRPHPGKENYSCKQGAASIVEHFFRQASIGKSDIVLNCRVTKINPLPSGKVEVTADGERKCTFDIVVSTMPVPQLLHLENLSELISDQSLREKLETVKYSKRFALGLFFDEIKEITISNHPINFIDNDPVYRYWSIENLKRTGTYKEPTSVVMHTNINFGASNSEEDKEKIKPLLLQKACNILPEMASVSQESVKSHKWSFSQVLEPYEGKPGCVKLNGQVYAAGDGLSESGIEGCINSAEKTILAIKAALSK